MEITNMSDFDKQFIKQQVEYRLENWLEGFIEDFMENSEEKPFFQSIKEVAYQHAKYELEFPENFEQINQDYELIDCDPIDEPENYKFQMEIIKKWRDKL